MSKSLTIAAWLAALSLTVIASLSLYSTLVGGSQTESSWVEYEACLTSNGYVAQGNDVANQLAIDICSEL
jgi:hypothetical protein